MSEKIMDMPSSPKKPEQEKANQFQEQGEIEKIKLSKEYFMGMVVSNGKKINSVFNTRFLGNANPIEWGTITKGDFHEDVQSTYEFEGKIYLVEFKVELGKEVFANQFGQQWSLGYHECNVTPVNIKLLELPKIDSKE